MRPIQRALLGSLALVACSRPMLRAQPVVGADQELVYRGGTPVLISHRPMSDVVLEPEAALDGRYPNTNQAGFVVGIRNRGAAAIAVSEASVRAVANGDAVREVEPADIAQEMSAGTDWDASFNAVTAIANPAAIVDGKYQVPAPLQRTLLPPGAAIVGGVALVAPRIASCGKAAMYDSKGNSFTPPGPCVWTLVVTVGNEKHGFRFSEVEESGPTHAGPMPPRRRQSTAVTGTVPTSCATLGCAIGGN